MEEINMFKKSLIFFAIFMLLGALIVLHQMTKNSDVTLVLLGLLIIATGSAEFFKRHSDSGWGRALKFSDLPKGKYQVSCVYDRTLIIFSKLSIHNDHRLLLINSNTGGTRYQQGTFFEVTRNTKSDFLNKLDKNMFHLEGDVVVRIISRSEMEKAGI